MSWSTWLLLVLSSYDRYWYQVVGFHARFFSAFCPPQNGRSGLSTVKDIRGCQSSTFFSDGVEKLLSQICSSKKLPGFPKLAKISPEYSKSVATFFLRFWNIRGLRLGLWIFGSSRRSSQGTFSDGKTAEKQPGQLKVGSFGDASSKKKWVDYFWYLQYSSWPLVGNEGMNPQYTNVKVHSLIPY